MTRCLPQYLFFSLIFAFFSFTSLFAGDDRYVTTASDGGPGSLRKAMFDSIAGSVITFDAAMFSPTSQTAITISSLLPDVTQDLTIDATGAGVTIDGTSSLAKGLNIINSTGTFKNLHIKGFTAYGVDCASAGILILEDSTIMACSAGIRTMSSSGSDIKGCYIGTNDSWENFGGANDGIFLTGASSNCSVGAIGKPNFICFWQGGTKAAIRHGGGQATIKGNYIGTNPAGANLGNFRGIDQQSGAGSLTLGGTTPGAGNVFGHSANTQVNLQSTSGTHYIRGNYIGTTFDGTSWVDLMPQDHGIRIQDSSGSATFNIGHPDAPNFIGFHDNANKSGIAIFDGVVNIEGNYIGTSQSGNDMGNFHAIDIASANAGSNITIGGTAQNEGNVLGFSDNEQVRAGPTSGILLIKSNWIGVTHDGASFQNIGGSESGILINPTGGSPTITIGGSSGADRNTIGNHSTANRAGIKTDGVATVTIKANHIGVDNKGNLFKNDIGIYAVSPFTGAANVGDTNKRLRISSLTKDIKAVGGIINLNGKISCYGNIDVISSGSLALGAAKLFVSGDMINAGTLSTGTAHVTFDSVGHVITGVITFDSIYYRGGGLFNPPQLAATNKAIVQKGAWKVQNVKLVLNNNADLFVGESAISHAVLTLDNAVIQSNTPGTARFNFIIRKFGDLHAVNSRIDSQRNGGLVFEPGSRLGSNTSGYNGFNNFTNVTFDNIGNFSVGMAIHILGINDHKAFPRFLRGIRFNKSTGATSAKNVNANITSPKIFFQGHPSDDFGTVATDGESGDTDPSNRVDFGPDLQIVSMVFNDLSFDGDTDQVVVSFDAPVKDLSVSFDNSITPARVKGFYLQKPGDEATPVRPNGWHSFGPQNDPQIALLFTNPQSPGIVTKDLLHYFNQGSVFGITSGLLMDFVTSDNPLVNRQNDQTSVVTSDNPSYADNGSSLTSVTMDFSGAVPTELRDPNRWLVIAQNGVQLNILGVSVDDTTNSLHITVDGTLGNIGTPKAGWIDFNPNLKMTGLSTLPGFTGGSPSIQLNWNIINHPALNKYVLFKRSNPANPWVAITETTNTVTLDQAITSGTQYYYIGRALYANGSISLPTSTVLGKVDGTPPTVSASASPTTGTAPLTVAFTATASDADGTIVLYEWDFNTSDSNPVNYTSPNSPNTTFTYFVPGSYNARLKVFDNSGNVGVANVSIVVSAPTNGPTASASLNVTGGPAPLTVTYSDTSTAGANPIALWEWDFEGDGHIDFSSTATGDAVNVYRLPNQTYSSVKLRVTDTVGKSDVATYTVTVGAGTNAPLVTLDAAQATATDGSIVSPSGSLPFCVTFDATTYDAAGGTIVRWEYDFNGDGLPDKLVTADTGIVTHCYTFPGVYTPTVTIRDDSGLEAIAGTTVTVSPPTNVNVILVQPVTQDRVAGNFLLLRARTIPAPITSTVLFEQSTNGSTWSQVGSTQTGAKFHYLQGLDLSGYADGTTVYVRARATDINSNTDTSPVVKLFKVGLAQAEIYEQITNGKLTKEASFDGTSTTELTTSTGAGFSIPLDAISQDAINTGGLRAKIIERGAGGPNFANTSGLPTSGGSPSLSNIGQTYAFDISLANGGEVEIPEKPLTLTIPYLDANNDGIIDGTSQSESTIKVYWFDEITNQWKITQETSIDTDNNLCTVTTAHLTDFGMFATVVSSALGGGAGVPGGATAGVGLCLIDESRQGTILYGLLLIFVSGVFLLWLLKRRHTS